MRQKNIYSKWVKWIIRSEFFFFHLDDPEHSDIENPPELEDDLDDKVGKIHYYKRQKWVYEQLFADILAEEENVH